MQTLKTDIKRHILQVAHREFIKNGVQRICIRDAARKAGVIVGDLYHHFDSKDTLFCVVLQPLLTALNCYILSYNDEEFLPLDVLDLRQQQINHIMAMLTLAKQFRPELRLLLFNTEGASLEGYKNKIIDYQMKVGMGYPRLVKERHPYINTDISPFLIHLASSAWTALFCELVEHEEYSEEEVKQAFMQYITFGTADWEELMKP